MLDILHIYTYTFIYIYKHIYSASDALPTSIMHSYCDLLEKSGS